MTKNEIKYYMIKKEIDMIFEQLIFTILSFALFVFIFFKMIKENDRSEEHHV